MNTLTHRIVYTLVIILILSFSKTHAQISEGVHYEKVNLNTPTLKGKVTEFFSFSCPGCYFYEQYISALDTQSPDSMPFQRIHARYGGRNAEQSQLAFVLMRLLEEDKLKSEIFNRIHQNGHYFKNEDDVVAFFVDKGHDKSKLEQLLASFSAKTMLKRMDKTTQSARVTSIPTLIVDGRFKVNLAEIKSQQQLVNVIQHLSQLQ